MNAVAPAKKISASPTPVVTLTIVVINLAVAFTVMVVQDWIPELAFYANKPTVFSAFSSLFLHTNIFHLLANLVFMTAVGPLVEFNRGRAKFILIYFLCGLGGVVAFFMWARTLPSDPGPLMGASAAVAGCFGYASVVFFGKKVPVAPKIAVPVWVVGLLWFALQAGGAFIQVGGVTVSSVAFVSHLTGFVLGVGFSLIFKVPKQQSLQLGHEVLNRLNSGDPHMVVGVADRHLRRHPNDVRMILEKAEALVALDKYDEATQAIQPLISSGNVRVKAEGVRFMARIHKLGSLSSMERLKLAVGFEPEDKDAACLLVESVLSLGQGDKERPNALLEMALMLRDDNPSRAKELISELESCFPLDPATSLARAKGLTS